MIDLEIKSRFKVYLMGISVALTGFCFGQSICIFNTFFKFYMEGCFPNTSLMLFDEIKAKINLFMSIGMICSTLTISKLFEWLPRRVFFAIILSLFALSSFLSAVPNLIVLYICRFVEGGYLSVNIVSVIYMSRYALSKVSLSEKFTFGNVNNILLLLLLLSDDTLYKS